MLKPFNTDLHVVLTPNQKILSWLLPNCNFATLMDHNVNICVFNGLLEVVTHRLRIIDTVEGNNQLLKQSSDLHCGVYTHTH